MTNHPNMGVANYRFIAFSTITGTPQAHAASPREALTLAVEGLPDADFLEVLDCGENGEKIWTGGVSPTNPVPLYKARARHPTVFRGSGYAEPIVPGSERFTEAVSFCETSDSQRVPTRSS